MALLTIHVHHYHHPDPADLRSGLSRIERLLQTLLTKENVIMVTTQQLVDAVAQETTLVGGVGTLVSGLEQQLKDALSGTTLPPAVQANVDAAFAGVQANITGLTVALQSNVPPPAPAPTPTP